MLLPTVGKHACKSGKRADHYIDGSARPFRTRLNKPSLHLGAAGHRDLAVLPLLVSLSRPLHPPCDPAILITSIDHGGGSTWTVECDIFRERQDVWLSALDQLLVGQQFVPQSLI